MFTSNSKFTVEVTEIITDDWDAEEREITVPFFPSSWDAEVTGKHFLLLQLPVWGTELWRGHRSLSAGRIVLSASGPPCELTSGSPPACPTLNSSYCW